METGRLERFLPLTGAVFGVFFAVAFFVSGEPADVDASGAEVIAKYDDEAKAYILLILLLIAAVGLMFFAGVLRSRLREAGWESIATTAFGGAVVTSSR